MCAGYDSGALTVPSGRVFEARAVREGRTGYLVEPGNAAELAAKIARCVAESAALGANARQAVEERFNWDVIGQQLLNLYDRVLAGRLGHARLCT